LMQRLVKAWLAEREGGGLEPLPHGLLEEVSSYLAELRSGYSLLEKGSLRQRLIDGELELTEFIIRDILSIRVRKMLLAAAERKPVNLESSDDWEVLRSLLEAAEEAETLTRAAVHGEQRPMQGGEQPAQLLVAVRVLKEVPGFVGVDGKTYGPFAPEEVAAMPAVNAKILARGGFIQTLSVPREGSRES